MEKKEQSNGNRILTDLPRWEDGRYKGKIKWREVVGMTLDLLYKGEVYKVDIIGFDSKSGKLKVLYNGYESEIVYYIFTKGSFGNILRFFTSDFRYNIGDVFEDKKRNLIITDREYRKTKRGENQKWYKYTCDKCSWTDGWIEEHHLKEGKGCSCCAGQTIVSHINSIYAKAPWMIELGISEEDAKINAPRSNGKIEVTCPNCGSKKMIAPSTVYREKTIGCTYCSDGRRYPEKFMTNVLTQLSIEFETQYSPDWVERRFYDFYIPSLNMIIETHGLQHYEEVKGFYKTLKEEQENDRYKHELALSNGIDKYIVIDCRYSRLGWVKLNICERLKDYFDINNVDWIVAEEFASSSLIKEVCDYWNNKEEWETTQTIADNNPWGIKSSTTIREYLNKGTERGLCSYDGKAEAKKGRSKSGKLNGKGVEIFKDGISLGVFDSCMELSRQSEERFGIKLNSSHISDVCRGKRSHHQGYTFKYLEWEELKQVV